MSDLLTFDNEEFGNVRVFQSGDSVWFVGKDVADILGYQNGSRDVNRHVDEEDRRKIMVFDGNQDKEMIIINESGLYSLILSSKLPSAKRFKRWVTSKVLPAIRKHGIYATPITVEKMIADPDFAISLLNELKESRKKVVELENKAEVLQSENNIQAQQIAEMNPKVTYYDEVLSCVNAVPITLIAKDYGWTPQQMNAFLHDNKIQYYLSGTWILYKQYQDKGYTKTQTFWYTGEGGRKCSRIQTKWTQKGRLFIYELMKNAGNLPLIEQE